MRINPGDRIGALDAIETRQRRLDQHPVGHVLDRTLQSGERIARLDGVVASVAQDAMGEQAKGRARVDHEHSGHAGVPPERPCRSALAILIGHGLQFVTKNFEPG